MEDAQRINAISSWLEIIRAILLILSPCQYQLLLTSNVALSSR
jgi:hypothetical protein